MAAAYDPIRPPRGVSGDDLLLAKTEQTERVHRRERHEESDEQRRKRKRREHKEEAERSIWVSQTEEDIAQQAGVYDDSGRKDHPEDDGPTRHINTTA